MELRVEKYVSSLPGTLQANTVYYVKTGSGFDTYITNNSGTVVAYPLNAPAFSAISGKPTTLSGYGITDAYPLTGNPSGFLTAITGAVRTDGAVPLTANWNAGAFSITANSVIVGSAANSIAGGAVTGGNLTLLSTTHATKGKILFGTSAYDEVNNRLGIGIISPVAKVEIAHNDSLAVGLLIGDQTVTALHSSIPAIVGYAPTVLIANTNNTQNFSAIAYGAHAAGAGFSAWKTRATTSTAPTTAVNSGDALLNITARGADGANWVNSGIFRIEVDGTVSSNIIPSRFVFQTMNTAGTLAERMRINNAGSVGINQTSPDASAILDIVNTAKGVLLPRMTTTQKNAISSPAEGLEVYDTTLHKKCIRTASAWETITSA